MGFRRPVERFGEEITKMFRSDYDPETSSVDGYVQRWVYDQTWEQLHDGAGTHGYDTADTLIVRIYSDRSTGLWLGLYRGIFTFDTSEIPPGSQIVSANVGLFGSSKYKTFAWKTAPAIYGSHPISDTAIEKADYGNLDDVILSNAIDYDDMDPDDWNTFVLNPAGLAAVNPGGITRMAVRDSNYDAPNIVPPWEGGHYINTYFHCADALDHLHGPHLQVTYREPL